MVEEIKIAEGFQQTELGILPNDWKIVELPEIGESIIGLTYRPSNISPYGKLVLRSSNVQNGRLSFKDNVFVEMDFPERVIVKEGDILICVRNGSKRLIGKCALIDKKTEGCAFGAFMSVFRTEESKFVFFQFQSNIIQRQINESLGATINQITNKDLASFKIPLPPTRTEQTAIATALSDMDSLIEGLEKLLVKKRNIKQGAMQELLKPKEGWTQDKLPTVCWFQEGPGLRNWQFTKKGIKVINVTNLVNGILDLSRTDRHISMEEFEKMYKHFEIDDKDIVMASSGNSYSKVAVVRKQDLRLLMNTSVIRFKPLNGLDYNYLLIFLKSNLFKDQIDLMITGGAQPNFGPYHLKRINILLPPTKEEQSNIGNILSDMDSEIQKLETQLSKYKMLKTGMMQELLTGKKRLNHDFKGLEDNHD